MEVRIGFEGKSISRVVYLTQNLIPLLVLVGLLDYDVRVQILGLLPKALGADLPCRCPYKVRL